MILDETWWDISKGAGMKPSECCQIKKNTENTNMEHVVVAIIIPIHYGMIRVASPWCYQKDVVLYIR